MAFGGGVETTHGNRFLVSPITGDPWRGQQASGGHLDWDNPRYFSRSLAGETDGGRTARRSRLRNMIFRKNVNEATRDM
jgi:hypothetical protein